MNRFYGKVALVTGGRSGIAQAIARRLRDEGARVFTAQRGVDEEFEDTCADWANVIAPIGPETVLQLRCKLNTSIICTLKNYCQSFRAIYVADSKPFCDLSHHSYDMDFPQILPPGDQKLRTIE